MTRNGRLCRPFSPRSAFARLDLFFQVAPPTHWPTFRPAVRSALHFLTAQSSFIRHPRQTDKAFRLAAMGIRPHTFKEINMKSVAPMRFLDSSKHKLSTKDKITTIGADAIRDVVVAAPPPASVDEIEVAAWQMLYKDAHQPTVARVIIAHLDGEPVLRAHHEALYLRCQVSQAKQLQAMEAESALLKEQSTLMKRRLERDRAAAGRVWTLLCLVVQSTAVATAAAWRWCRTPRQSEPAGEQLKQVQQTAHLFTPEQQAELHHITPPSAPVVSAMQQHAKVKGRLQRMRERAQR